MMRLALVERAEDGEVTLRLQPGDDNLFAKMGDLEKAMRESPAQWANGTNWTLVPERPILTVIKTEAYHIHSVPEPVGVEA